MTSFKPRQLASISYYREIVVPYFQARFTNTQHGASLVEYALLVALIAVVCIAAVSFLGASGKKQFSRVGTSINAAS